MEISFRNQVVLVAGGTGGLGRAVSHAFLNEGAKVIVTYRREAEFRNLQESAAEHEGRLTGFVVDVSDADAVKKLVESIGAKYGRLDVLVNAVGGFAGGTSIWETDLSAVDQMLTLNYRAHFLVSRMAAQVMVKEQHGVIVNVGSKAAVEHGAGVAAYAASKAAALALTDVLAAELKGTGVRANSVLPSIIDTEQNRQAMPKADFSKWPKPDEIANVILFLCSDAAKLIHGAAIPVYGSN